eukprot:scaffold1.g5862.t1
MAVEAQQRVEELLATTRGDAAAMAELIAAGADINVDLYDGQGRAPLQWACWRGQAGSVRLLLRPARGWTGETAWVNALMWAAQRGADACAAALLAAGARTDLTDKYGQTAQFWAVEFDHATVIRQLLQAGASLDRRDHRHHRTALHSAAAWGATEAALALAAAGADPRAADREGCTPLTLARKRGRKEVCVRTAHALEAAHAAAAWAAGATANGTAAASGRRSGQRSLEENSWGWRDLVADIKKATSGAEANGHDAAAAAAASLPGLRRELQAARAGATAITAEVAAARGAAEAARAEAAAAQAEAAAAGAEAAALLAEAAVLRGERDTLRGELLLVQQQLSEELQQHGGPQ